jgi:hypothetical protein
MIVPVKSAETKRRRRTTRVTSHAMRSAWSLADFEIVEKFQREHGRYPQAGDGEAFEALQRMRGSNLQQEASAPRQPWEPSTTVAWRQRTAVRELVRLARPRTTARPTRAARPREAGAARRRRGDVASRGGDGGDSHRRPSSELARRERASRREKACR